MENGEILDGQITASSEWNANHGPANGRVNFKAGGVRTGAWSSRRNDLNQWLQVDFELQATVTEIMTQGRSDANQWVKSYAVTYSNDGVFFDAYQKNGIIKVNKKTKFYIRISCIDFILTVTNIIRTGLDAFYTHTFYKGLILTSFTGCSCTDRATKERCLCEKTDH